VDPKASDEKSAPPHLSGFFTSPVERGGKWRISRSEKASDALGR
jgi:hypothetical protein